MLRFDPDAMYSRDELDEACRAAGTSFEVFARAIGLQPLMRKSVLGAEILAAVDAVSQRKREATRLREAEANRKAEDARKRLERVGIPPPRRK